MLYLWKLPSLMINAFFVATIWKSAACKQSQNHVVERWSQVLPLEKSPPDSQFSLGFAMFTSSQENSVYHQLNPSHPNTHNLSKVPILSTRFLKCLHNLDRKFLVWFHSDKGKTKLMEWKELLRVKKYF